MASLRQASPLARPDKTRPVSTSTGSYWRTKDCALGVPPTDVIFPPCGNFTFKAHYPGYHSIVDGQPNHLGCGARHQSRPKAQPTPQMLRNSFPIFLLEIPRGSPDPSGRGQSPRQPHGHRLPSASLAPIHGNRKRPRPSQASAMRVNLSISLTKNLYIYVFNVLKIVPQWDHSKPT